MDNFFVVVLSAILVCELVRLVLAILDGRRVGQLNRLALQHIQDREAELDRLREEEIDGIKLAAQGCQMLADILEDLKIEVAKERRNK